MAVTMYTTPTCPYCKMAKEFFKEKGVSYVAVDVAEDSGAAQKMIDTSGQMGVPVIVVPVALSKTGKEEVIVGFDRGAIESTLGIAG